MTEKKLIEVVAAVIEYDGRILCVQRGPAKYSYISKKWEFPGGKIELDESHEKALLREIKEELDLTIEIRASLITVDHEYPDFKLKMHAYDCTLTEIGNINFSEHIDHCWLANSDLKFKKLDWAEADIPIVDFIGK